MGPGGSQIMALLGLTILPMCFAAWATMRFNVRRQNAMVQAAQGFGLFFGSFVLSFLVISAIFLAAASYL